MIISVHYYVIIYIATIKKRKWASSSGAIYKLNGKCEGKWISTTTRIEYQNKQVLETILPWSKEIPIELYITKKS